MGWACRLTVEPHQAPAGCDLTQRSPLFAAHLRAPLLVHVRSSLHENRDDFVVLVHGRQAQDRPVLVVTAVGVGSLPRGERDKLAQEPVFVAPACPPSSKSLAEVNCLIQERGEAGSPGPALKTAVASHR